MKRIAVTLVACAATFSAFSALAQIQFNHTTQGTPLDLSQGLEDGRDTEAVKTFLQSGENPYTGTQDEAVLAEGEELYLTACSGCHGHYAEGKLGPGLNDSYWTYPKNETDKGLFETIYGGAEGMMGPQYNSLNLDEMLHVIAWVRHLYTGEASDAKWLTPEQRETFEPYDNGKG